MDIRFSHLQFLCERLEVMRFDKRPTKADQLGFDDFLESLGQFALAKMVAQLLLAKDA